tara:strand:+ start:956 stop:1216 length:261 start_codon:yes stop_codon:yes gene_type:complete
MDISILKNLNNVTKLHESLDWDDNQLNSLFQYLDEVFNSDIITHPEALYEEVETLFGENTRKCFEEIFKQSIFELNLHIVEPNYEN